MALLRDAAGLGPKMVCAPVTGPQFAAPVISFIFIPEEKVSDVGGGWSWGFQGPNDPPPIPHPGPSAMARCPLCAHDVLTVRLRCWNRALSHHCLRHSRHQLWHSVTVPASKAWGLVDR